MSTTLPPHSANGSSGLIRRVFGASPFHTDGDLITAAFTSEGTLWTLEEPSVLRLWDLDAQQQLDWFSLEEPATAWAFAPNATLLAGGSRDVCVWEPDTGVERANWPQTSWVTALAFHPNGEMLASAHESGIIRLWNWSTQTLLFEMIGHPMPVSALAFRHDGQVLASAGEERAIRLWDVEHGTMLGSLLGHTDRIPDLAWHPDGRRLVSTGWDTTARVWDTQTFEPIILLNSHSGQVFTLAFNADGSRLACADSDHAIHLWDMDEHRPLDVLRDRAFAEIRCVAFHPSQKCLVFGGVERIVNQWDLKPGEASTPETSDPQLQRVHLAPHPEGQSLLTVVSEGSLHDWNLEAADSKPLLEGTSLTSFALSPDGNWIVGGLATKSDKELTVPTLTLYNARTGEFADRRVEQRGPIVKITIAQDSRSVAAISHHSSDVWTWAIDKNENGPLLDPILLFNGAVEGCVVEGIDWHPDCKRLAIGAVDYLSTGGSDGQIAIWNIAERRCLARFEGGALDVVWHPEGRYFASAALNGTVKIWDSSQNALQWELRGHLDIVNSVAYSPDGQWLASSSDDHTLRLWNASTGAEQGVAEIDTQAKMLAFSPDGKFLYTGNNNTSCYQIQVETLLSQ